MYNFDNQLWRIAFENQHSHIWENCFHENQMDLCIKTIETLADFFFQKNHVSFEIMFPPNIGIYLPTYPSTYHDNEKPTWELD